MARVKLELPDTFPFSTEIPVRITDINYGGHVGNDAILAIVHEARVRFLGNYGYTEADIDGVGIIMTDAVIVYKSEAFYGMTILAEINIVDITRSGCDFVFRLRDKESGKEIARAKTGVVFFDYQTRKLKATPPEFKKLFDPHG
jgi:acyl-CoA thioester hydrolase